MNSKKPTVMVTRKLWPQQKAQVAQSIQQREKGTRQLIKSSKCPLWNTDLIITTLEDLG